MKAQLSTQSRQILTKKPSTKVLNEKKNSVGMIESTLKKQKSKPNLILNSHHESTENINAHKVVSPKNIISNFANSITTDSAKIETSEEHVQHEKQSINNKKTLQTNKIKKSGLSKMQPIKKEFLTTLRSPKNSKPPNSNICTQSQVFIKQAQSFSLNTQPQQFSNISMDASMIKTERLQNSVLLSNTSTNKNQYAEREQLLKQHLALAQHQIQELTKANKQQSKEIVMLKEANEGLQRKLNKMRLAQDENKRKLRQRIGMFNEQGEEIKQLKEKIILLQRQVQSLLFENEDLKKNNISDNNNQMQEIIKIDKQSQVQIITKQSDNNSIQSLTVNVQILAEKLCSFQIDKKQKQINKLMIDQGIMTMLQDEMVSGDGNNSVKSLDQSMIGRIGNHYREYLDNMQIQGIKSLYEVKYQQKILSLQSIYNHTITDIQNRITLFLTQSKQIINQQQAEITSLWNKLDQIYERLQQSSSIATKSPTNKPFPHIDIDEQQLLHMSEINSYKVKLAKKDQVIKNTKQQLHILQIQLKSIQTELDIQRIKHSLNYQVSFVKKQLQNMSENEEFDILESQLRYQRQKNVKLLCESVKKQQLIRKLSAQHQLLSSPTTCNIGSKKLRK